jgi:hypothetical protein
MKGVLPCSLVGGVAVTTLLLLLFGSPEEVASLLVPPTPTRSAAGASSSSCLGVSAESATNALTSNEEEENEDEETPHPPVTPPPSFLLSSNHNDNNNDQEDPNFVAAFYQGYEMEESTELFELHTLGNEPDETTSSPAGAETAATQTTAHVPSSAYFLSDDPAHPDPASALATHERHPHLQNNNNDLSSSKLIQSLPPPRRKVPLTTTVTTAALAAAVSSSHPAAAAAAAAYGVRTDTAVGHWLESVGAWSYQQATAVVAPALEEWSAERRVGERLGQYAKEQARRVGQGRHSAESLSLWNWINSTVLTPPVDDPPNPPHREEDTPYFLGSSSSTDAGKRKSGHVTDWMLQSPSELLSGWEDWTRFQATRVPSWAHEAWNGLQQAALDMPPRDRSVEPGTVASAGLAVGTAVAILVHDHQAALATGALASFCATREGILGEISRVVGTVSSEVCALVGVLAKYATMEREVPVTTAPTPAEESLSIQDAVIEEAFEEDAKIRETSTPNTMLADSEVPPPVLEDEQIDAVAANDHDESHVPPPDPPRQFPFYAAEPLQLLLDTSLPMPDAAEKSSPFPPASVDLPQQWAAVKAWTDQGQLDDFPVVVRDDGSDLPAQWSQTKQWAEQNGTSFDLLDEAFAPTPVSPPPQSTTSSDTSVLSPPSDTFETDPFLANQVPSAPKVSTSATVEKSRLDSLQASGTGEDSVSPSADALFIESMAEQDPQLPTDSATPILEAPETVRPAPLPPATPDGSISSEVALSSDGEDLVTESLATKEEFISEAEQIAVEDESLPKRWAEVKAWTADEADFPSEPVEASLPAGSGLPRQWSQVKNWAEGNGTSFLDFASGIQEPTAGLDHENGPIATMLEEPASVDWLNQGDQEETLRGESEVWASVEDSRAVSANTPSNDRLHQSLLAYRIALDASEIERKAMQDRMNRTKKIEGTQRLLLLYRIACDAREAALQKAQVEMDAAIGRECVQRSLLSYRLACEAREAALQKAQVEMDAAIGRELVQRSLLSYRLTLDAEEAKERQRRAKRDVLLRKETAQRSLLTEHIAADKKEKEARRKQQQKDALIARERNQRSLLEQRIHLDVLAANWKRLRKRGALEQKKELLQRSLLKSRLVLEQSNGNTQKSQAQEITQRSLLAYRLNRERNGLAEQKSGVHDVPTMEAGNASLPASSITIQYYDGKNSRSIPGATTNDTSLAQERLNIKTLLQETEHAIEDLTNLIRDVESLAGTVRQMKEDKIASQAESLVEEARELVNDGNSTLMPLLL